MFLMLKWWANVMHPCQLLLPHSACEDLIWSPWGQTLSWCCCHRAYCDAASVRSFHFLPLIPSGRTAPHLSLRASLSRHNVLDRMEMFGLWSSWPSSPTSLSHLGGPHSAAPGPERTGWSRGCGLACPIMSWITPPSPLQLFNCYPPFCGVKPNCVELDRRGAHWKPLAWGVFSLLRSECWHGHNFIHTRAHTKCQLRDLWGQRERRTSRQHSF